MVANIENPVTFLVAGFLIVGLLSLELIRGEENEREGRNHKKIPVLDLLVENILKRDL